MLPIPGPLAERAAPAPAHEPERVANRPARITYQPADTGIALFRSLVREGLAGGAPASADFLTAVRTWES